MSTRGALSQLIEAMSEPGFYPDHPDHVERRQTHTAYVFLAGDFAYKVKKPVSLPFIDCSTPARRRELCEHELRINRRLSPEVYRDVLPIIYRDGAYHFDADADCTDVVVDYAVKMQRLPDARRLDHMVMAGTVTADDVRGIAQCLARFHAQADSREAWTYGSAGCIWRLIMRNLQETIDVAADNITHERLETIGSFSRRYLTAHWEFLNRRARDGRVRDGHGDLRGDSIYLLPDGIRIIDALEFSESLRYGDVASEIAFLAMDLDRLGRPELSNALVEAYSLAADDADVELLLPLYKSYRATIRAKVELIKSRQADCPLDDRVLAREQVRRYLELACEYARTARTRGLLIVCGLSGTGKSTLAHALRHRTGFTVLASDAERKRLAGVAPTVRLDAQYGEGPYRPEFSARVYRALIAQAETLLRSGTGVIIDATFQRREERAAVADLARRVGLQPIFIECRAPHDEVVRRLIQRNTQTREISDANVRVYLAQSADFEPLDELPSARHLIADTTQDLGGLLTHVERLIQRPPTS